VLLTVFKTKKNEKMDTKNESASANATPENSAPSETKKKNKNGKSTTTGVMNSQVVKMLVGDEIARLAHRCEPIIGSKFAEVGEMIAEDLAVQSPDVKAMLLEALVNIERESSPSQLSKKWVDWREAKARAKEAEEEKRKQELEAKKAARKEAGGQGKAAEGGHPAHPEKSPAVSEASPADQSQAGAEPMENSEKPLATATEQLAV
jgi:hypothetical protein